MTNKIELRKAERSQVKLRIGLGGPSGSGKTYSALLLARGMASAWDKVALIDTENKSGDLYSQLGNYNVITLEPPYSPERYLEAIKACEDAGMEVIILDSATHEWDGKGGILEYVDSLGGKFQDWAKATPRHRKFIDGILQSTADVLVTMRKKQDYAMEQNSQGKSIVKKLGMKEIQREGFEYELTLNFDIETNHMTLASKDRTGLFMGKPEFVITEQTGQQIREWNSSGKALPPDYTVIKRRIITEAKNLGWDPYAPNFKELVLREVGLPLADGNYEAILKYMLELPTKKPAEKQEPAKDQTPPAEPPVSSGTKVEVKEKTKEQIEAEKQAARDAAEKASPQEVRVFLSLLEQKEGVDAKDMETVLGYLSLVKEIEIKSSDELTRAEVKEMTGELLKKKTLPPEPEEK